MNANSLSLVNYDGFQGKDPKDFKLTVNLDVENTFFNEYNMKISQNKLGESYSHLFNANFYNNTISSINELDFTNTSGLIAHNTIKGNIIKLQDSNSLKNNIIVSKNYNELIEYNKDNILADLNDISDIIEDRLTEIKGKNDLVVRKYFKPVDNSKAIGFKLIQGISELSTDML